MGAFSSRHVETSKTDEGENARIKYAASSIKGWRTRVMETAHAVVPDLDRTTSFFGVYDGHGGAEIVLFCAKQFHVELRSNPNYQTHLNSAMRSVFSRMDELLQQSNEWMEIVNPSSSWIKRFIKAAFVDTWRCRMGIAYIPPQMTGSRACVAITRGNRITVGNVGDSRCVVSRNGQAIQLSTDHKPNNRNEKRRIQRAGGKILLDKYVAIEAGQAQGARVLEGLLATSRIIGDFVFKSNNNLPPEEQMVICYPDIRSGVSGRRICELLVHLGLSTSVDTTVVLIQFKHGAPSEEAAEGEDAREDQEIAPDRGEEEQQPFLPDAGTAARALDFLKARQKAEEKKS